MKKDDRYQSNSGAIAIVEAIRGNKVYFIVEGIKAVVGYETFLSRFPRKVST